VRSGILRTRASIDIDRAAAAHALQPALAAAARIIPEYLHCHFLAWQSGDSAPAQHVTHAPASVDPEKIADRVMAMIAERMPFRGGYGYRGRGGSGRGREILAIDLDFTS
jgi:hypothetical protein